ncbi:LOW QUALITY PROTEIN: tectonin beta-propeller repeat-containing protein 1-like [Diaphorina citri]|uniref:LOW QUALITY PROTEIN: tectonin beta-propeller repeat-containing protein 1-like n=2 Tax=Diaphorina citri TaxID=121845 RepID=A0A3Q0J1C4_DIACI|nr:LOW QUALITY PROTEIN: tectonin beta-propeller repeat-containing protein 1-like [Diaphorina citri]
MPSSMLFGINNEGRVYSLYTNGTKWREFPYLGVEFKRLSSVPNFLWAIGGDRQIYVHVHGFDIPIRIKEEVYENQRWNPIEGFVSRLLPSDRYEWSNKDGTQNRTLENIRLPSFAWEWESSWQMELTLDGQPLDHDGWTYATDFPNTYTPYNTWTSGVRRRKWFRYRKYSAMNAWCAIAPLYKDSTQEPFIDVCIGGHNLPGDTTGMMLVWAVTAHGRLMFRSGVARSCPEGKRWISVTLPAPNDEVRKISCGPTGLTWAVLWSGQLYVRTEVSASTPQGEGWVEVLQPEVLGKVTHVSVGTNSVWVSSDTHSVWFRRGVTALRHTGAAWIAMSGRMMSVSVAPNDQVWAVGVTDRRVYYRSGVTPSELTGRSWRPVRAPIQLSRHSTQSNSLLSLGHRSSESSAPEWEDEDTAKSAPTRLITDRTMPDVSPLTKSNAASTDCVIVKNSRLGCPVRSVGSLLGMEVNPDTDDSGLDVDTERDAFQEKQNDALACVFQVKWSCVEAGAVHVSPSNLPRWFLNEHSFSIEENETWRTHILAKLQERHVNTQAFHYENAVETISWVKSIQSKVCLPGDSSKLEDAIVELECHGVESDVLESAEIRILAPDGSQIKLTTNMRDVTNVQSSSDTGSPRISMYSMNQATPVVFQLSTDAEHDDLLANMIYVCCCLYRIRSSPSSKSYWATTRQGEVLTFDPLVSEGFQAQENTGSDFMITILRDEDGFCISRNGYLLAHFESRVDPATITHVTIKGDVLPLTIKYLSNKPIFEERGIYWRQLGGHLSKVETCDIGVTWGLGFDHTPWVYTGGWGGSFMMGLDRSKAGIETMTDTQVFELYENQRWNPISGYSACMLPTDRTSWSDETGTEKRSKETCVLFNTHWHWDSEWHVDYNIEGGTDKEGWQYALTACMLPTDRTSWSDETGTEKRSKETCVLFNTHWHWDSEWHVDYNIEGGTDKEGWQYALDFPCAYHASNSFTDTARRRKWRRVAKYVTQAPWLELGNTKLQDLSLHTDTNGNIHVWGIVPKGDALYRRGVTLEVPSGISWEHVSHDEILVNISGYNHQVWAVGVNGCAYWRYGVTGNNPMGETWRCVDPPRRTSLVQIAVGEDLVWCRDADNVLYTRLGVSRVCWEGTHWQAVPENKMKYVTISRTEVWGITPEGHLSKRLGVTKDNPAGYCWVFSLPGDWTHLSVKR